MLSARITCVARDGWGRPSRRRCLRHRSEGTVESMSLCGESATTRYEDIYKSSHRPKSWTIDTSRTARRYAKSRLSCHCTAACWFELQHQLLWLRALPKITESIVQQIQKLCWVGFTRMGHALALRDDSSGPSARCTQAFSGDGACFERTEPPAFCRDGSACAGTWRGELDVADQRAGTLDDLSWTCRHHGPCFCSVGTNP